MLTLKKVNALTLHERAARRNVAWILAKTTFFARMIR